MRKLLVGLLLLSLLVTMIPMAGASQTYLENGYEYTVANGEATFVGYKGQPEVIHIPETLGGYPVTTIGNYAFWSGYVREVYVPESVQFIEDWAFDAWHDTTVYLPDNDNILFTPRSFVGELNIYGHITPRLELLYAGEGFLHDYGDLPCAPWELTPINEERLVYAIYDNEAILLLVRDADSMFEVPQTLGGCPVTRIASQCFRRNFGEVTLSLPDSIRHIGYGALESPSDLTLQSLPSSLEYIAPRGLSGVKLAEETLPASLRYIGDHAFSNCNFSELVLNDGLEHIGNYAFSASTWEMEELTIPQSVKFIGRNAFENSKLRLSLLSKEASCEDAFEHISSVRAHPASTAMQECSRAGIPFEDIETGARYEFSDKVSTNGFTFRVTQYRAELLRYDNSEMKSIVDVPETVDGKPVEVICSNAFEDDIIEAVLLPDTVQKIESDAFTSCDKLYYIKMSKNLREIRQNAVSDCDSFTMIYLPPSCTEYLQCDDANDFGFKHHGKIVRIAAEKGSIAQAIAARFDYTFINARKGYDYISQPSGVYETDGQTATMVAVSDMGNEDTLVVPDEVFGIPITRIAGELIYPMADNDIGYETIILGNNIVSIGEGAFARSNLINVHVGRNVQEMYYPLTGYPFDYNISIYGYTGTYAEAFARQYGYRFYPYNSTPFHDVSVDDWYHDAVSFCYWRKLLSGTYMTTFEPNEITTRAMVAKVLYNLSGKPPLEWVYGFKDVESYDWYGKAVNWCRYYGLAYGTSTWYFSPNDYVTREQVATFFYRYAEVCGLDVSAKASLNGYRDAWHVSDYAKSALQWAVANKIMVGNSPTTLNPKGYATRAELAMIIMNFANYVSSQ